MTTDIYAGSGRNPRALQCSSIVGDSAIFNNISSLTGTTFDNLKATNLNFVNSTGISQSVINNNLTNINCNTISGVNLFITGEVVLPEIISSTTGSFANLVYGFSSGTNSVIANANITNLTGSNFTITSSVLGDTTIKECVITTLTGGNSSFVSSNISTGTINTAIITNETITNSTITTLTGTNIFCVSGTFNEISFPSVIGEKIALYPFGFGGDFSIGMDNNRIVYNVPTGTYYHEFRSGGYTTPNTILKIQNTISGCIMCCDSSNFIQQTTILNQNGCNTTFTPNTLTCSMSQNLSSTGTPTFTSLTSTDNNLTNITTTFISGASGSFSGVLLCGIFSATGVNSLNAVKSTQEVDFSNGISSFTSQGGILVQKGLGFKTFISGPNANLANITSSTITGTTTFFGTTTITGGSGLMLQSANKNLTSYYWDSFTSFLTGSWLIQATGVCERIGNIVNVIIHSQSTGSIATSTETLNFTLPSQYRPGTNLSNIMFGNVNNSSTLMLFTISSGGVLTFATNPSFGNFTSGQMNGLNNHTILSWSLN